MSEEQLLIGEDNERDAEAFFTKICKWKLIGKNIDLFSRSKGGIDQLYEVYDELIDKTLIVPVECKCKQDYPPIEKYIYDLKNKIEKIQDSKKIQQSSLADYFKNIYHLSVVFLNHKDFDIKKYKRKLETIPIKDTSQSQPVITSILANNKICQIKEILKNKKNLEFFAPLIAKNKEKGVLFSKQLSYTLLFSDIICGKYKNNENKEVRFIISFEKLSENALNHINSFMLINQFYNGAIKKSGVELNLYFIQSEKYNYNTKNENNILATKFSLIEKENLCFLTDNFKIENSLESELNG